MEARFAALDIDSQSEVFTLTVRHSLYRRLQREFALALSGEYLRNETFLLGEPFPFALGAEAGKTRDTAIRFTQEWLERTPNRVLALRSRFSLGVDALGATLHGDSHLPDEAYRDEALWL